MAQFEIEGCGDPQCLLCRQIKKERERAMTTTLSFVDMLVITQRDNPVSVQVTVTQPSGAVGRIVLSAEQMDTLCESWRDERALITVDASQPDEVGEG